ncbi:trigger factor [Sulfuricurvum sp.]|uniref:trigger factor n=1 Tax=Sulfuricurvum sp. TaxID=2025608 RepID=UPI0019CA9DA9|nr:trigger factor [Sulfuricurvum sp.]MBD3799047.1 trigger factor [Campylobacterota bacterium]MBD3806407.1 trigger factor [Sulfuricurvum sp.]
MQITTNKIDSANAKINAAITRKTIDANIEKIANQLSKEAKIAGFRKGKVPVSVIKKQYGERLVQDAEAQALRDLLNAGLAEMAIAADTLIGEPQIAKFEKTDDGINVEVVIATRPAIELGDYAAMVPEVEKPTISDEEVTTRIEELALAQAPLVNVDEDRALESGDTALIDFEGFVDGEAFEGGKAEGFSLRLGSGQFIPGFEDQVIGMKKDEEKTIDVTFPENYGGAKLAGKAAQFKVKVNAIQTKEAVTIDDELAKKMLPGYEDANVEMLKEKVKEQLESEAMSIKYNDELKPNLMETFVNAFTIDLPEFIVEQEMDMALNKKARELSEAELEELRNDAEKVKEMRETFRNDACRAVKATFIVDALAKAENITVGEQELLQTIYYEAMQMGQDPAAVYKHYQESGYLPAIQMAMIEDRVLSKLLNDKIK